MIRVLLLFFVGSSAMAATGRIKVDVANAPGEITLDGMPTDQTAPAIIDSVAPGEHLVELQYGCMKGSARVTVYEERMTTARLRMRNVGGVGTVRLRGLPPMARVYVDDAPVRQAGEGIELACGGHRIRAESEGFADWEETVAITTDRWTTVSIQMVEIDIEEGPRPQAFAPVELDDEFDDLDDFDDLDWEEEDRLLEAERAEERAAQQQTEQAQAEASRRERYGDVDDLDEVSPEEMESDPAETEGDGFGDYNEELSAPEDEPDPPMEALVLPPKNQPKTPRNRGQAVLYSGIGTAVAGIGTLVYGLVLHKDYVSAKNQWNEIVQETQSPTSAEAQEYGQNVMNPTKEQRNRTLSLGTGILLAGGGLSAYAIFQTNASLKSQPSSRPTEDLEVNGLALPTQFGIRFRSNW